MKLKNFRVTDLIIKPQAKIRLQKLPTEVSPLYKDDENADSELQSFHKEVRNYQERLYAEAKQSLLIIIQGMDTSGKDGLVEHLMSGINPQGVHVVSFKQPSTEELAHDFLWRSVCNIPRRGSIGIFNRSYYEDVVVTRVHPELLLKQNLPSRVETGKHFWQSRFDAIVNFEHYLSRQGWTIVKVFLHVSKKEQKKRLMKRIEDRDKHWKFDPRDVIERGFWDDYQETYAKCLANTSTSESPWYVVPADDKVNARLIVSKIIINSLKEMNPDFPKTSEVALKAVRLAEKKLKSEKE